MSIKKSASKEVGRPAHRPNAENRRLVAALAGCGARQEYIAQKLGVHYQTLAKHYSDELEMAVEAANARVAKSLFEKAVGDGPQSVTAAIFWLKTRAGWKETQKHEIEGGRVINIVVSEMDMLW